MEWFHPKRRGPQWKHGWASQTLASMSTPPPPPLLTIFFIVILLLWLSQYTDYKAQFHQTAINFKLFLFLLPILLIFLIASYSTDWMLYFRPRQPQHHRSRSAHGGSSPWVIAIFVAVLLVLLSYQSTFHSKWFGPLRSD